MNTTTNLKTDIQEITYIIIISMRKLKNVQN